MSLLIDTNVSFGPASATACENTFIGAGASAAHARAREPLDLLEVEDQREAVDERLRRELREIVDCEL